MRLLRLPRRGGSATDVQPLIRVSATGYPDAASRSVRWCRTTPAARAFWLPGTARGQGDETGAMGCWRCLAFGGQRGKTRTVFNVEAGQLWERDEVSVSACLIACCTKDHGGGDINQALTTRRRLPRFLQTLAASCFPNKTSQQGSWRSTKRGE